jgi:hypothetical protein
MNELKDKPGWLETLWNKNPGLAERAEKTIKKLTDKINYDEQNKRLLRFRKEEKTAGRFC